MTANFYKNTSDNRYLHKTLETIADNVPCVFKQDTSMINPSIIISRDNYNNNCNYVYLAKTNRYYYVRDKVFSQQKVEIILYVDVRSSFNFSNCNCIARRSTNKYNAYLNDSQYQRLQYSKYALQKFPKGFSKATKFVLTVAGGV